MTTLEIICLYGLGISLCLLLFDAAGKTLRAAWRRNGRRYGVAASLIGLAVVCTINAQKPGPTPVITVDSFLADAGSYATNDVLHVAVTNAPAYAGIDFSSCPVLVYARPRGLSDAPWKELLPRRTFSELPADYAIEDATNYNYLVYLDYVPPSPVHTNGVFELRGFVVPGDEPGNLEQLAAGFATSTIVDNREIVPIEYLESTGTQWIDTGVNTATISQYITDTAMLGVGAEGSNVAPYIFIGIHASKVFYGYVGMSSSTAIPADNDRHIFEAANTGVVANDGFYIDGVKAKDRGTGTVASAPFYLFACYQSGGLRFFLKQKKYAAQIYCNGIITRDFIPVRVGRIGYMFDRVSGEYLPFGNKGTGAFILGPDIKE